MNIPTAYRDGYVRAREIDPILAERYVRHTCIGDPAADALIGALQQLPREKAMGWTERGIEGGPAAIADAPAEVRKFFAELEPVPAWFNRAKTIAGGEAFYRHSEMFILAVTAAIMVEGFSTGMSKSFAITGKMVDAAVRRLRQNNRHIIEIMLPGGLDRKSDGWKLSLRARLVHARIRNLLTKSPEWDAAAWGTPLSASHISLAVGAFSGLLLKRVAMLGVTLSEEERESFTLIWRYSGHVMGVQPELEFTSEAGAMHLLKVGATCEPPPGLESIMLANAMINSAPLMIGLEEPAARRKWARWMHEVSRGLMGDAFADQLNYPPRNSFGLLTRLRWANRIDRVLQRTLPPVARYRRRKQFQSMLNISHFSDDGLRYRLPQQVHAEKDKPL